MSCRVLFSTGYSVLPLICMAGVWRRMEESSWNVCWDSKWRTGKGVGRKLGIRERPRLKRFHVAVVSYRFSEQSFVLMQYPYLHKGMSPLSRPLMQRHPLRLCCLNNNPNRSLSRCSQILAVPWKWQVSGRQANQWTGDLNARNSQLKHHK